jgi:Uncharacterized protein involved in cytokinesis, contains TGc (transglutaminase/protease-like) domain
MAFPRIGYDLLSEKQKEMYDVFRADVMSRKKFISFNVEDPAGTDIDEVFFAVRQDDPYLFFLSKMLRVETYLKEITVIPKYLFSSFKEKRYLKKIDDEVNGILNGLPDDPLEKEKAVYKAMTSKVTSPDERKKEENYSMIGALLRGVATCDGTALATKVLMNRAGIRCGCVHGTKGDGTGHMWNIVELNGSFYHLDATKGGYLDNIFNLTDEEMEEKGFSWEFRSE